MTRPCLSAPASLSAPTAPGRRSFLLGLAGAAAAAAGGLGLSAGPARAVVVGGGPAGAAAALAWAQARPQDRVALVERDPTRLARRTVTETAFAPPNPGPDLSALREAGVEILLDDAVGADWAAGRLSLFSGRGEAFDRLLVAPGAAAAAEAIPGLDAPARHLWPAAWGSAREARRLGAALSVLPEAGHVVLRLPADSGGRPAVALGRARALAAWLARHRPAARLTVLQDAAEGALGAAFRAEARRAGWRADWRAAGQGGRILSVDAPRGAIETEAGRLRADAVNFISPQQAGRIAHAAGLTDASGWCPAAEGGRSALRGGAVILGDARRGAERSAAAAMSSALDAARRG